MRWAGLGGFSRVAACSRLCFTGTRVGTRTLEPVTGGVAIGAQGQHARLAPRPMVALRGWRATPASRPRASERPPTTRILFAAGPGQKPQVTWSPSALPGVRGGSRIAGCRGASPAPVPDWPPLRSPAGRTGIGTAGGQSRSNGTPDAGLQFGRPRGWCRRRAQSPRWESGRDPRTMPYLLISTQIRIVSTTADHWELGPGPGRGGCGCTLVPSSQAAPAGVGPGNCQDTPPRATGEGGWGSDFARIPELGALVDPAPPAPRGPGASTPATQRVPSAGGSSPACRGRTEPATETQEALASHVDHSLL